MKLNKKILLGLSAGFVAIQFIQPVQNKSKEVSGSDFQLTYSIPDNVSILLQNACYDCHSNNTKYPWYSFIQPGAWWMASHIKKGKAELNFSEFGNYSSRRQQSKLKSIINRIKDNEMPLQSYKILHKEARLSEDEKMLLTGWMQKLKDSIYLSQN